MARASLIRYFSSVGNLASARYSSVAWKAGVPAASLLVLGPRVVGRV
ncbi:MAG: hypothetical protein ACRYFR_20760 [Janthinobacterium lividum]